MARTVNAARHEQRRGAIVAAAAQLFADHGYAGTTTAGIATAAGISTGALFHYFRSKRELFLALFELDTQEWERWFAQADCRPDPWAALLRLVDRVAAEALDPSAAGLVVETMAQARRDPAVAALVEKNDRTILEGVSRLVRRLEAAGVTHAGMPPEEAARWVVTLLDGLYSRGYPEPDFDPAAETGRVRTLLARLLRHDDPEQS